MKIVEILSESVVSVWGRKGSGMARRYRCTAGIRKGRIVSSPTTCTKPKDVKKSFRFKATRARRGSAMGIKASRTKRATVSSRVRKLNISQARQKLKPYKPGKRKPIRK
jgi:hypothetical protein